MHPAKYCSAQARLAEVSAVVSSKKQGCHEGSSETDSSGACAHAIGIRLLVVCIGWLSGSGLWAVELRYAQEPGLRLRVREELSQKIYLAPKPEDLRTNREPDAHVYSLSRVLRQVMNTNAQGIATIQATYQVLDQTAVNAVPVLRGTYQSKYLRASDGSVLVSNALLPSVRGIPRFPDKELSVGDTWSFPAEEQHQGVLADSKAPFRTQFMVDYRLTRVIESNDLRLAEIDIQYAPRADYDDHPNISQLRGAVRTLLYWDLDQGYAYGYVDVYEFLFTLRDGQVLFYTGTTRAEVDDVDVLNEVSQQVTQDLSQALQDDLPKEQIQPSVDGLLLRLGDILFDTGEASLQKEARDILREVATVLRNYPRLDLLITGHTDNTGSDALNQGLSLERAKSVAQALIEFGIEAERIGVDAKGDKDPIADNATTEGRQKNRRVDLEILSAPTHQPAFKQ